MSGSDLYLLLIAYSFDTIYSKCKNKATIEDQYRGRLSFMSNSHAAPLYDHIGVHYDATRRADPFLTERLAHNLRPHPGGRYLDIACGTGNYTVALAEGPGAWHGLDLSSGMLQSAVLKGAGVFLFRGDAAALPFRDDSFDGAICTMALHHLAALPPVFCEASRVICAGRLVIFTSTAEQMEGYWLNEYFPIAMSRSSAQMPSLDLVLDSLAEAGFSVGPIETYDVRPDLQDFFLYSGKHRPELYLSEEVRRGVSTFSTQTDSGELETGCRRLREDIASGRINEVVERYRNEGGDYAFIVASK